MDQRRLRPGDSLDDYCPRERRLTDHVVVAVVDDVVKQTRCVACDTEHPYKDGRVPPRRRKPAGAPALVRSEPEAEVETGVVPASDNGHEPHPNLIARPERKAPRSRKAAPPPVTLSDISAFEPASQAPAEPNAPVAAAPPADEPAPTQPEEDEGPVHRRLIRATLPRQEGQVPARPLPEFTIRQPGARTPFGRGGAAGRFGKGGANRGAGAPWQGKPHGQGNRAASGQGHGGDPRARHKPARSRPRHHHKKTR
jgi:hypothetical protein